MKREKYKTIKKTFKTKRDALIFQQSLRNKLFSSLSVYAFNQYYIYSRSAINGAFHWSSKVEEKILFVHVTKVSHE